MRSCNAGCASHQTDESSLGCYSTFPSTCAGAPAVDMLADQCRSYGLGLSFPSITLEIWPIEENTLARTLLNSLEHQMVITCVVRMLMTSLTVSMTDLGQGRCVWRC